MKFSSILASALTPALAAAGGQQRQCFGYTPQPGVSTYLGAQLDYETSERICCNNHRYAEYAGYLQAPEVDLFGRLDPEEETVFYDSVCGLPLFVAPRGRTFEEFRDESIKHGWPSFRPDEIVSENVIIHGDGRMESRCLTHLGHNLPTGGVDRYCIDLVCVAGAPLTVGDERYKILSLVDDEQALHGDEFDADSYVSSAEDFSGNYRDWTMMVVVGFACLFVAVGVGVILYFGAGRLREKKREESKGHVVLPGAEESVGTEGSDEVHSVN